jgi:cell division protein ZapA
MQDLKINVVIGGRTYPIRIKETSEEEGIRKAALKINNLLSEYEDNYAVNDKQDVLAMCALQFASQIEIMNLKNNGEDQRVEDKLKSLNTLLDKHLE